MHLNSELLFTKYAVPYFKSNFKVLEIGPSGVYQRIVNDNNIIWDTIDFENTKFIEGSAENLTHKLQSAYDFPIDDEVYDIVLSGQVIEHVEKIWTWLSEIKRITKKGGIIITINPVSWPYHEAPIDCWRIFPNGIHALAQETDMTVLMCMFESLEKEQILAKDSKSKFIPGKSYNFLSSNRALHTKIIFNKIIRKIPRINKFLEIPIEVAYDTISVLKK